LSGVIFHPKDEVWIESSTLEETNSFAELLLPEQTSIETCICFSVGSSGQSNNIEMSSRKVYLPIYLCLSPMGIRWQDAFFALKGKSLIWQESTDL